MQVDGQLKMRQQHLHQSAIPIRKTLTSFGSAKMEMAVDIFSGSKIDAEHLSNIAGLQKLLVG